MSRKLLIIIFASVIVLAVIVGAYVIIVNRRSAGTGTGTTQSGNGSLPPVGGTRTDGQTGTGTGTGTDVSGTNVSNLPLIARLGSTAKHIMNPTLSADGLHIWYFDRDQKKFIESNLDGTFPITMSKLDKAYDAVSNVIWSPAKDGLILERIVPDQPFTQKTYIRLSDVKETDLNPLIDHIVFSPDGQKVYYQYVNTESNKITLNIANADGTQFRSIKDFPIRNIFLAWITGVDKLMFYLAPSGYRRSTFYLHDQNGENVLSLMEKGYGVDGVWSPKGTRLLATWAAANSTDLHLRAVSVKGTELRDIQDVKTFIDKCAWSNDPTDDVFVYCAVPRSIDPSAILPEDYNAGKLDLTDDFYRINTRTGEKVLMAESPADGPVDATQLVVHRSGDVDDALYFVNRKDGNAIWELNLTKVKFPDTTSTPASSTTTGGQ